MTRTTRREMLAALGATAALGLAGCSGDGDGNEGGAADGGDGSDGGDGADTPTDTPTPTEGMGEMTGTETMGTANVRVAHFSPDAPAVDVLVNGEEILADVPFRAVSDYLELPAGTHTVALTGAGESETVYDTEVTIEADTDYTVAALGEFTGDETEFQLRPYVDENDPPDDDTARIRLLHAAPDISNVDVATRSGDEPLFEAVMFGEAGYVEVPEGTYTLTVGVPSMEGRVEAASFPVELSGGTVYTGFAGGFLEPGDEADDPFDLTLTVDAGAGGGGLVDPANLRVGHFSPDAPNVDVYVDGDAALTDVPFRALSDYLTLPSGTRTIEITAAGDPDTSVFEGDVDLAAADYTVAAVGELDGDTEFRPLVLEDDNSDPGDSARVRLVHAAPDAPAVDVTAGGSAVFDGVAFGETATGEVPGNDYTLNVRGDTESNDGDVVADFDVSLTGGTAYTAFAVGYLTPDDEPADEAFDLQVAQDASF